MKASMKLESLLCILKGRSFIIFFYLLCLSEKAIFQEEKFENFLLCKFCGTDVADLNYSVTLSSPLSIKEENQTFSGKSVFVQTLKNPSDIYFDVILVKKSNCIGYGEWKTSDTWFPGYAWKVCICRSWGHFLGWVFEPISSANSKQKQASDKGFYALIIDNVLSEEFSNSLLVIPKSLKS